MDVREKLVELQLKADLEDEISENTTQHREYVADLMIANGVTVQGDEDINVPSKWISVKDRLPEHGDVVLCFMKFGEQRILQWDEVSSWWLGYGCGDDWQKADVTHWQYLPQPPKGE